MKVLIMSAIQPCRIGYDCGKRQNLFYVFHFEANQGSTSLFTVDMFTVHLKVIRIEASGGRNSFALHDNICLLLYVFECSAIGKGRLVYDNSVP